MSEKSRSYLILEAAVHAEKVAAASQPPPGTKFPAGQIANERAELVSNSAELFAAPASSRLRWLARMAVTRLPWGDQLFASAEEEAERRRQLAFSAGKSLLVVASTSGQRSAQYLTGKFAYLFPTSSGDTVRCDLSKSYVSATIGGSEFNLETNQTRGNGLAAPNLAEVRFVDCTIIDQRKQPFLLSSIPPTPATELSMALRSALAHVQDNLGQQGSCAERKQI